MYAYHKAGDTQKISFTNPEFLGDAEQYERIISILKSLRPKRCPNAGGYNNDLLYNEIDGARFSIVKAFDEGEYFLYCENESAMMKLEGLFNKASSMLPPDRHLKS